MLEAMSKPLHQMVHDQYMKDKDKLPADFEAKTNQAMDDMWNTMPFDEMMQSMVPVYQKHLTKGDIDALIEFYGSPTGQKVLREMPQIMSEAMQAMMPLMRKQIESMQERIQKQTEETLKQSDTSENKDTQNGAGRHN